MDIEKIKGIREKISRLKRQRATRPQFGKQRSRDKNGMTKDEREEFKQWKLMKKEGKL